MTIHKVEIVLFWLRTFLYCTSWSAQTGGISWTLFAMRSQLDHEFCVYFGLHAYLLSQRRLLIQRVFLFAITIYTGVIRWYNKCTRNGFRLNKTKLNLIYMQLRILHSSHSVLGALRLLCVAEKSLSGSHICYWFRREFDIYLKRSVVLLTTTGANKKKLLTSEQREAVYMPHLTSKT